MSADKKSHVETLLIYKDVLAQKQEIERHKWFESEKAGKDIGYDAALINWVMKHKSEWKKNQRFFKIRLD
jgi:hypothetical protein